MKYHHEVYGMGAAGEGDGEKRGDVSKTLTAGGYAPVMGMKSVEAPAVDPQGDVRNDDVEPQSVDGSAASSSSSSPATSNAINIAAPETNSNAIFASAYSAISELPPAPLVLTLVLLGAVVLIVLGFVGYGVLVFLRNEVKEVAPKGSLRREIREAEVQPLEIE